MKCINCAYFEFNHIFGMTFNTCNHVQMYVPPAAGYEIEEHECEFFIEKSGISKWESYTDEEKEEILMQFEKMYHGNDKSFDAIRNTYPFEEAKEMFIGNMKSIDKNRK